MSRNAQGNSDRSSTDSEEHAMSDQPGTRAFRRDAKPWCLGLRRTLAVSIVVGGVGTAIASGPLPNMGSSPARQADCVVTVLIADGTWIRGIVARIDSEGWHLLPIPGADSSTVSPGATIRPIAIVADLDGWCAWNLSGMREASDAQPAGMLVIQDAQLIPGALEVDGAVARWNHRWIGKIPLEVDRIRSLRLARGARVEPRDDADVVALVNGDEIIGFVEAIGTEVEVDALGPPPSSEQGRNGADEGVESVDQPREQSTDRVPPTEQPASGTRAIDLARVASIAFASTGATAATTPRAWTRDGSVVSCRGVAIGDDGALSFFLADDLLAGVHAGDTGSNLAADVVAILVEPDRIHPLAELVAGEAEVTTDAFRAPRAELGVRATSLDHLLGLDELRVLGPQSIEIDVDGLRDGECVFTATLSILEPAPADSAVGVEMRADGVNVGRARVTASGSVAMTAWIPAGVRRLEFVIDDGGNGIAGDRLLIRRGAFVVGPRPSGD